MTHEKTHFLQIDDSMISTELKMLFNAIDEECAPRKLDYAVKRARYINEIHDLDEAQLGAVKEIFLKAIEHKNTSHETILQIERWVRKDRNEHYVLMKHLLGAEPHKDLWYGRKELMDAIEKRPAFYGGRKVLRN